MHGESNRHKLESILQDGRPEAPSLPLEDLRKITNDFSDERLLGVGGFGKVYKGVLQNGDMIAVKKLTMSMPGVHDRQFENEAHHLMRLKHPNIVQLVGYCSETENVLVHHNGKYVFAEKSERLLCLEYLPNGSLREHLSGESSGLDWDTRYRIIEGVCSGLHYLHEEWQVGTPIIHMDLKPANILLDDNMVPKIADFGISRLFGNEKTRTCTQSRDGTLGYMAPEYINRGVITKKLDIFSLGVIIIEIITGRKDYSDESETSSQEFIELVIENWRNRLERTSLEIDCEQITRCIRIGLACVKLDRARRPTTRQIIERLHGSADFSDEEVLRLPANEVLPPVANMSSKAAGTTYTSLERTGRPKRRILEIDPNHVETNGLERPAKKDFIDHRPSSSLPVNEPVAAMSGTGCEKIPYLTRGSGARVSVTPQCGAIRKGNPNSEWEETIQRLNSIAAAPSYGIPAAATLNHNNARTTRSSSNWYSSTASSSASCPPPAAKLPLALLSQAVVDIADGNIETAAAQLAGVKRVSNQRGDPDQRLLAMMVTALSSRIAPTAFATATQHLSELCGPEQRNGIQLLHEKSPVFSLALHAANVAIVGAVGDHRAIHLVDFDVSALQHAALIQYLADRRVPGTCSLKVTAVTDPTSPFTQHSLTATLPAVGERLKKLAERAGVEYHFELVSAEELDASKLGCEAGEALAVNLAFALSRVPDESVSVANPRDRLLRQVRALSPEVVTLVEQELDTNTTPLVTRFMEACVHYGAILDSLEATLGQDSAERAMAEAALAKKAANTLGREASDRLERCEVLASGAPGSAWRDSGRWGSARALLTRSLTASARRRQGLPSRRRTACCGSGGWGAW